MEERSLVQQDEYKCFELASMMDVPVMSNQRYLDFAYKSARLVERLDMSSRSHVYDMDKDHRTALHDRQT